MRLRLRELDWWQLAGPVGAAVLLGFSRLLPASGFGLWLRLAAATVILLLAGRLVARALGRRSAAATLTWSVALVGVGLALTFALGESIDLTLAFVLAGGTAALGVLMARGAPAGEGLPARGRVVRAALVVAGLAFGGALWPIHGHIAGDGFFHLGRIRKLDTLHALSLHDVGEFRHGGLHPGYAFPLWHGWLALVARLAGVDPTSVALHETSLLAPLAFVLAFEMGWVVFRSTGIGLAVLFGQVALKALAPGHGGVYPFLWQPASAATQLFLPAAVTLFFVFLRRPAWQVGLTLAFASASLSLVHPTYTLFLAVALGGFLVVRFLFTRGADWRRELAALVVFGVPMTLVFVWLLPIIEQTVSVSPGPAQLRQSLVHYRVDLIIHSLTSYSLSPARVDRSGSVDIAALVLVPLALFARRRRWSALVLGGSVAVLAITLLPFVFPHFADAVSLSQARRAASFAPYALAFAGGIAVLVSFSRAGTIAVALAAGIGLQVAYGGNFGLRAPTTQPALAAWIALYGGLAAIVAGTLLAWRPDLDRLPVLRHRGVTVAVAAFLFCLPVAVHGFSEWTPKNASSAGDLTPGLIHFLQRDVPVRSVIFGDLGAAYRAIAYAPVYAVDVPPTHAANTKENQIFKRRLAWFKFLGHPSLYEPRRWHANWVLLRHSQRGVKELKAQGLKPAYKDSKFVLFRVPPGPVPLKR